MFALFSGEGINQHAKYIVQELFAVSVAGITGLHVMMHSSAVTLKMLGQPTVLKSYVINVETACVK